MTVGEAVGVPVGEDEGETLGETLGDTLGETDGDTDGETLGDTDGEVLGTVRLNDKSQNGCGGFVGIGAASGLLSGALGATACCLELYNLIAVNIATPARSIVMITIIIVDNLDLFFFIIQLGQQRLPDL